MDKLYKNLKFDNEYSILHGMEESTIFEITEGYRNSVKVEVLIDKYKLGTTVRGFARQLPRLKYDACCPHCGNVMWIRIGNRYGKDDLVKCDCCNHQLIDDCNCEGCNNAKKEIIEGDYASALKVRWDYSDISYSHLIYLMPIIEEHYDSHTRLIELHKNNHRFGGYSVNRRDRKVLEDMIEKKILLIHPSSPIADFTFTSDGYDYNLDYVCLKVNVVMDGLEDKFISSVLDSESELYSEYLYSMNCSTLHEMKYDEVLSFTEESFSVCIWETEQSQNQFILSSRINEILRTLVKEYRLLNVFFILNMCIDFVLKYDINSSKASKYRSNEFYNILKRTYDNLKNPTWVIENCFRDNISIGATFIDKYLDLEQISNNNEQFNE